MIVTKIPVPTIHGDVVPDATPNAIPGAIAKSRRLRNVTRQKMHTKTVALMLEKYPLYHVISLTRENCFTTCPAILTTTVFQTLPTIC